MTKIVIPNYEAISWNKIYSSNNWRVRKKIADDVHQLIGTIVLAHKPIKGKVDISITAYYKNKRKRDSDNVNSKVIIDSLRPRIIEDDDTRYVGKVTTEAKINQKENKVVIELKKSI